MFNQINHITMFNLFSKNKKEREKDDILRSNIVEDNRKSFYRLEDIRQRSMGGDLMLSP